MSSRLFSSIRVVSATLFVAALCFAQTQSARLIGTIHDSTGAVVPNAKVTATSVATKVKTEVTSNATGDYVLPALQPGTYSLTVEATGFRKAAVGCGIVVDAAVNASQSNDA